MLPTRCVQSKAAGGALLLVLTLLLSSSPAHPTTTLHSVQAGRVAAGFATLEATSRLVTMTRDYEVPNSPASLLGGPAFGMPLPSTVLGFALSSVKSHRVLAGRVRTRFLESDIGVLASPGFGPARIVRPGTYVLTTFGPARRVIKSLELPRGTTVGPAQKHGYNYFAGHLSQTGLEVHPTAAVAYASAPRTFTVQAVASNTRLLLQYSAIVTCLVDPEVETCADKVVAGEAGGLLPGIGQGAIGVSYTQPGSVPGGRYKRLFEATSGSLGATSGGMWLSFQTPELRRRRS